MTERDALYAAVLAAPADDLPRLVFADWCDDHGDPERAEFIRVQVELVRYGPDDPRRVALEDREDELLGVGHDHWKVPGIRGVQGFVRGFVERWDGTADWLLAAAGRLFEVAPVRAVRVRNADRAATRLASITGFARVEELDLSGNTLAAGERLYKFLTHARLDRLRSLKVCNNRLFSDDLPQIASTPVAARLFSLDLSGNPLGYPTADDGMSVLAGLTGLSGLRELVLRNNEQPEEASIHARGAEALARSPLFPQLARLDLTGHRVGEDGLLALLASPLCRNLNVLRMARNDIGRAGEWASRLPEAAPSLLDLSGRRNTVHLPDALALRVWPPLGSGTSIDLRGCSMTRSSYEVLAASPLSSRVLLDPQPPEDSA